MSAHDFSAEYIELHFSENQPWLHASGVPGADASSYRVLNHAWSIDRGRVYLRGRPLKHVDRASFTVLNELYARDATRIFSSEGRLDGLIDPTSFEVLDDGYCERWGSANYEGYARDARRVYFGGRPRVIRGADPASFQVMAHLYARDRTHAYLEGKRIEGAEAATFEVITELYAKDANHVFYAGSLVEGADPSTFALLDRFLAIDARHVYDRGRKIAGADPLTFKPIEGTSLAVDRDHVFALGELQAHVDRATFEHLGHDYFADRNGIYWGGKLVKGAHRDSFVVDGYSDAHDRLRRYYENTPLGTNKPSPKASAWLWRVLLPFRIPFIVASAIRQFWREMPEPTSQPRPAERKRKADMRVLATVLANGNEEALAPILLAIEDMDAFRSRYLEGVGFADEPSYEDVRERLDEGDELHPFEVMEAAYHFYDLIGVIDWRSDMSETIEQVDPMLRYHGIEELDWSFIDTLLKHGDGSELRNNNLLSLLQDRLAPLGLTLVHVNLLGDSYGFAIVPHAAYERISGFTVENLFEISRDFGPDEAYDRGKAILARQHSQSRSSDPA